MTVPVLSLPDKDSPFLVLVHPSKAEVLAHSQKNAVEWRGALSFDAYLRREEHLSSQALTKDSGITYWVLVDSRLLPHQRVVLAGCETYRKRALLAKDGHVDQGIAHGVGSVFTPPEFRGRGYGARMIAELATKLRTWQTDQAPCFFSVLYSDIGKKFYARHGWSPYQSAHIHLPPKPFGSTTASGLRYLEAADLPALCMEDEALTRHRLSSLQEGGYAAALCPDQMTMSWHHAREEFVAAEVLGRVPRIKGAITSIDEARRAWCIWTRMYYCQDAGKRTGNTLHVLRLVVQGDRSEQSPAVVAAIGRLLAAAQAQANEWMAETVELWNPLPASLAAAKVLEPATKVVHREQESIASLKWYGPGPGQQPLRIEWLELEKYAWC